jgi:anaerobic magnesium-protoporphyrin IX monomethyl ester cyclase
MQPMPEPKRHKVVLYNPTAVFFTMPLALVTIGSHLDPERYEVVIIDGRLEKDPLAALAPHLDGALCFGVTVLTGAPIQDAVTVTRKVAARHPDLPVVWGGWHPSMFGKECLDEPAVHITVQGQGEVTFAELCDHLAEGHRVQHQGIEGIEGIPGLTYRDPTGQILANPPRPFNDMNDFARHNYELIEVPRYYGLKGKKQLDYISSEGCPYRCAFCADPFVYQRKWAGLDPDRMADEIEGLWQRYRFDDINFQDETFFTYPKRVEAFADQLIARQIPTTWAATMRADQGTRMDDELFAKLKRSGLRRVLIGVESGSQEMMDRIKKDIKLEQVFTSAERCARHGVAVNFPFIVGFPEEPEESLQATLDVVKRLRSMSPDFETPIFYFRPYPGSAITQDAVAQGHQLPCTLDEWSDFDFVDSKGPWVSPDKFRKVERFKYYQRIAYQRPNGWTRPLQKLARWRCDRDNYALPVEKVVSDWLFPREALS